MTTKLSKKINQLQCFALAIGSIIGLGCFVMPTDIFLPKAGPIGSIIGLFIAALFACVFASILSDLICRFPQAGGVFIYTHKILDSRLSFICGWSLLIGYMSIIAINITAIPLLIRYFIPHTLDNIFLYSLFGWNVYFDEIIVMSLIIIFIGFLNLLGIKFAGIVQLVLSLSLTVGIIALFIFSLLSPNVSYNNLLPLFSPNNGVIKSILLIVAIAPWLFVGFDTVPQSAEEFLFNPNKARNIMILSIISGALLYSLTLLATALPLPYENLLLKMNIEIRNSGAGWGVAFVSNQIMGNLGQLFFMLAVFGAVLSGINGFFIASSRLILSMSRAGIMPQKFSYINDRFKTPTFSIIFVLVVSLISPYAGRSTISWAVEMSSVGIVISYLFASLCVFKVFKTKDVLKLVKGVFGIILAICALLLLLFPYSPAHISTPAAIILLFWVILGGIIVWWMWLRNFNRLEN